MNNTQTKKTVRILSDELKVAVVLLANRVVDASRYYPDRLDIAIADLRRALNPSAITRSTPKKAAAARANGKKGGRPRKQQN